MNKYFFSFIDHNITIMISVVFFYFFKKFLFQLKIFLLNFDFSLFFTSYKEGQNKYILDENKYPRLKRKSGVPDKVYSKNKLTGRRLELDKTNIFDEEEVFNIGNRDFDRLLRFLFKSKKR